MLRFRAQEATMNAHRYGDWTITHDPKPIPDRRWDWSFVHDDYDGPGDDRCGDAASLEACKAEIDGR